MSTGIPEPVMSMLVALVRIVPEAINAFSEDGKKAILERLDGAAARLPEPGAIDAATEALIARHRARVSPQVTTSTADVLAKLTTSIRLSDEERHALVQAVGVLDILTAEPRFANPDAISAHEVVRVVEQLRADSILEPSPVDEKGS